MTRATDATLDVDAAPNREGPNGAAQPVNAWITTTATKLIEEEQCERCGLRRWRRPGETVWLYGNGDGRWTSEDLEPGCSSTASRAGLGTPITPSTTTVGTKSTTSTVTGARSRTYAMAANSCERCGRSLTPRQVKRRARFCKPICRAAAYRLRQAVARLVALAVLAMDLPSTAAVAAALRAHLLRLNGFPDRGERVAQLLEQAQRVLRRASEEGSR